MQLITILYYSMYLVLPAYKPKTQASEPCPYDCFQAAAIRWQKGRMGVPKLEPTLPAAQRMAAAKAVLSSLPPDQLLRVLIRNNSASNENNNITNSKAPFQPMMYVRHHKPLHPSHTLYSACRETHCTSFLAWICQKAQLLLHSFLSTQYVPYADMCCS